MDLLAEYPNVASYYGHFLTPGNVLTSLYEHINDASSQLKSIVEHLVVGQFNEQLYTKLEQAGASSDNRPKLYELFVDLPFVFNDGSSPIDILDALVASSSACHKVSAWEDEKSKWHKWLKYPKRSRVIILKGGPGQGKSTVGQYFAQIQRAALILSSDGPRVAQLTRSVAENFKKVAIAQGFWPSIPRIPVTVELKDFAAWYGMRSDNAPKGILSYICEKISLKTEQDVLPGTMKRALGLRSWFINFDGLDEVPNDVKDDVAGEINKFTNEMLPLMDADVLTLCTTRPQGYSGQFEKLEASTAVLSALPPSTALACASAVVKFDRSVEESQYSIDVLTSAMQSVQVLELMTTPLQAHIMAVVVRDGGRPPEKRWELFDNFYKVMKKRESQKNFQDPRISKLLREDDTLLKAIHTRLGVVLHVLSEDSRGAETTLDKSEFKELAYKTTSVLIDENVDGVVEALMEATTERLVFVNTPESSNTVRFDVRQLQEFFAGEFIYGDVSPAEMRSRMEAICTDSHWREVMHFSLSALVFNGRRTELAVASQVLTSADSIGNCHKETLFSKKMAIGALLGIRLLNEGVLEQDKRLRQVFTNVLTPLYALPDPNIQKLLTEKKHVNSQAWLLNEMIDHLFDASEAESIGAALALIYVLPDDHIRVREVLERLMRSSNVYLAAIYNAIYKPGLTRVRKYATQPDVKPLQNWFLIGTLQMLISNDLRTGFDYGKAIGVLRGSIFQLADTDFFKSLSVTTTKLLFALMDVGFEYEFEQKELTTRGANNYSGFLLHEVYFSWRSSTIPDCLNFDIPAQEKLAPLLEFIKTVIDFSKHRTHHNFKVIAERSVFFGNISKVLPASMLALLPLSSWQQDCCEQMTLLLNISAEEFDSLIKTGKLNGVYTPYMSTSLVFDSEYSSQSWVNICRDYPVLALDVWMRNIGGHRKNLSKKDFIAGIAKLAEQRPELMGRHILQWGKLFKLLPDQGLKLRGVLRDFVPSFKMEHFYQSEIIPFELNLVSEISFVPLIAEALIGRVSFGSSSHLSQFYKETELHSQDLLNSFGVSQEWLKEIFFDDLQPINIRQAALAIFFSQEYRTDVDHQFLFYERKLYNLVELLMTKDTPLWFVKSLIIFSENYLRYDDPVVRVMIGDCFYKFRENYTAQLLMQNLLNNWRERSNAPVQTRNLLNIWLSGDA